MSDETYDSTNDTLDHINKVRSRMTEFSDALLKRATVHDASKLEEPEKSLFDKYTPLLKETPYGSEQYKAHLAEMGAALQHHYAVNAHHPEHYPVRQSEKIEQLKWHMLFVENNPCFSEEAREGITAYLEEKLQTLESRINGMTLMDVVEMFCDWKAAGERREGHAFIASLMLNRIRFGLSEQLYTIFVNTAKAMYEE